ncbi:uncharacterized protein EDB91DRAFT_1244022 [Suillus paluster]|uniref:uncharacterized protein n=1 Tax=Suillus paluster TaxID=48578 RepID=UPI001B881B16|nr:uncharacterized protein EDB91DRAFT_1244022 [Suillus paluster]KAG1750437.1 hypothetical protein EDB91DRAFT_1244022 [Suillus paluster]
MSSQNGGYDQNLLDEAPAATRAQRQEGYNVDLLDDRPNRPLSTQPLQTPPPQITHRDTDVESNSQEKVVPGAVTNASPPTKSFWRRRNGIITIFVIVVVVLGAVIGGAVGGTVGKHSSTTSTNAASTTIPGVQPTSSAASGGAAPATDTPTAAQPTAGRSTTTSSTPTSTLSSQGIGIAYGNTS